MSNPIADRIEKLLATMCAEEDREYEQCEQAVKDAKKRLKRMEEKLSAARTAKEEAIRKAKLNLSLLGQGASSSSEAASPVNNPLAFLALNAEKEHNRIGRETMDLNLKRALVEATPSSAMESDGGGGENQTLVERFYKVKKEEIRDIFRAQTHREGDDVLVCTITEKRNCVIPQEFKDKYKLPYGIQGTSSRFNKQNFHVRFQKVLLTSNTLDLHQKYCNFEDPRDCAEIIAKLETLFEEFSANEKKE